MGSGMTEQERQQRFVAGTTDYPLGLEIVKAEGLYLYDAHGKAYMDLISGLAVCNLGHRHPRIVEAIKHQADQYLHVMVYGEYVQSPQARFAEALVKHLPSPLDQVYFVNSGTEANEAALKLAKRVTGRKRLVSCHGSYHGSTHGSLSVSGNETKKNAFRPLLPDVHFIAFNEMDDLFLIDEQTAAVIIEPIQGDAGIRIPSKEWMQALRARCDETGALLIVDEIQTGFGRTGPLFAITHFEMQADIITMGKGIAGGMAMGAFAARSEHMAQLKHDPMLGHITTFGGHPVCCAAGLANLEELTRDDLLAQVAGKGALFRSLLEAHPAVREVRQIGLFMAIEMEDWPTVERTVMKGLDLGFVGFYFLSCRNSFRLAPPLTITEDEIREACRRIMLSMDEAIQIGE